MKKPSQINHLIKRILILLITSHFFYGAQAQTYDEIIANLESQLKEYSTRQDTHKVNLLNNLSYAYRRNNPAKIDSFAKAALKLSEELDYAKGKGIAYKNLGTAEYKMSGSVDIIIEHYKKAIFWSKAANDKYTQVAAMNNIGLTYQAKFAYDKSIASFQKAIEIHNENLPEDRLKLLLLGNLGDTYLKLDDYQKAREYYDKLFKAAEYLKDEKTLIIHSETQALLLLKLNEPEKAMALIQDVLPKLKKYGDHQGIVKIQIILSGILLENEEFSRAHEVLNAAQASIKKYNLKVEQCGIFLNLSKIYLAEKKILKAKESGSNALACMDKNPDAYARMLTVKHLIHVYHADNDAVKAGALFSLYNELLNEYKDVQKQKAYMKTELAYQVKNKEAENTILLAKQKENDATILSQKTFNKSLSIIVFLSLLLFCLAIRAYFLKQKQNKVLDQRVFERTAELADLNQELLQSNKQLGRSNEELEKFAYIASHDLKQPLCTIVNFSKLLAKETVQSQNSDSQQYLNYILDSGGRMMNLIEDVLEYSKVDKKNQEVETIDLNQLVGEVKLMISSFVAQKNAKIEIIKPLPSIQFDKTRMLMVFKNLMENGIKYNTSGKPSVLISSKQEEDGIKILFQDNGIGIDKKFHHKLFKMFSRLQNHRDYEGTGLGLSICKKVADNMGGEIGITSNKKAGSLFYFCIPNALIVESTVVAEELMLVG